MTIQELIDQLSEYAESNGPDTRVCIAIQPGYPLALDVQTVVSSKDIHDERFSGAAEEAEAQGVDIDDLELTDETDLPDVVWIGAAEGVGYGQHPYAPREVWDR